MAKTIVDQQTARRIMRTGLTAYDPELAYPGYMLFGTEHGRSMRLTDLKGEDIHRWQLPSDLYYGYLRPDGNLFYWGPNRDSTERYIPAWPAVGSGIMREVDWDGKVVWEHFDSYQHHDARRTASGGVIYPALERVPDKLAKIIQGGLEGNWTGGVWSDVIVEVDKNGNRIWEWHAYEHLDPEIEVLPPNAGRAEWTHINTVVDLDSDHVMFSARAISVVAIVRKSTGKIEWRVGPEVLAQQHDCSELLNGNILVFNNGVYKAQGGQVGSSVLEIDRQTRKVVWEYSDQPSDNFYSGKVSGTRRLANGNTLITDGVFGRMFQVTSDKEVVWEYINPDFITRHDGIVTNQIFRSAHYSREELPKFG